MTGAQLLLSCAVQIKDEEFYVDAGASGAVTVNFLSSGSMIISKNDWDNMREGMFCMSAESLGDFKAEVEKLCSKTPCSYQVKEVLTSLLQRVHAARRY